MSENNDISRYYLKVHLENAIAEINLNDSPIIKNPDTEGLVTTEPVNLWLKKDINELSFVIYPDTDNASYSPRLTASLFLHDNKQDFPTPIKTLAEIEFTDEFENTKPATKTTTFKINDIPNLNLWSDADKIDNLSSTDKQEMLELTNALQQAILTDSDKAIQLQKYKINEDAIADAKTFERLSQAAKENYEWLRSQDSLKAHKISNDQLEYRICGDGYLVNLVRKDNSDALIIESESMYFEVPLFFAKINGNWVIAR